MIGMSIVNNPSKSYVELKGIIMSNAMARMGISNKIFLLMKSPLIGNNKFCYTHNINIAISMLISYRYLLNS